MDKLDFFCAVCGTTTIDGDIAANSIACRGCGAGWRTMELASGLLGEVSRGCHVVLRRFARDTKFQRCRILDFSFDPVIERELRDIPTYRKIVPSDHGSRAGRPDWLVPIGSTVPTRLPFQDEVMDALIIRDVVRIVPDIGLFIRECFRVLIQGGSLILQDRYRWPLPDETVVESDGQEIGAAAALAPSGSPAVRIRELGASFLAEVNNAGFIAYFERPAMSVDPLYRSGFIVGIKP
jgi:SAM-dependent methyltransferase